MDPQTIAALVQLGVAGVFIYAFLTDKIRTKAAADERQADSDSRLAEVRALYDARIAEGDERYTEMREDRNHWRGLTLGTERRLDQVTPLVATAVGVPVPSAEPAAEAAK